MPTTDAALALALLQTLESCGIGIAVIHGAERLLAGVAAGEDTDVVVDRPPGQVLSVARGALEEAGVWALTLALYDRAGSGSAFFADDAARGGVHLDMLYDLRGRGRYRVSSPALLERSQRSGGVAVVDPAASLLLRWGKASWKRQTARGRELAEAAAAIPERELRRAAVALFGSDRPATELRAGRLRPRRPDVGLTRKLSRLRQPPGFWAHLDSADGDRARTLAERFGRVLEHHGWGQAPDTAARTPGWHARTVAPVRLRAGLFVSWGPQRGWPKPDLTLAAGDPAGTAARVVAAMSRR